MYINKKVGLSGISVLEIGLDNDKFLWLIKYMEETLPEYMLSKYISYVFERSPIGMRIVANVDMSTYEYEKINNSLRDCDVPVAFYKEFARDSLIRLTGWFRYNKLYKDWSVNGAEIKISVKSEIDVKVNFN